jgi:hypothetical protein
VRVVAATVMDTVGHLERFTKGNLAGGADHLVVFLDAPGAEGQPDVAAYLNDHPHVTCVRAGRGWWGEYRPASLNERQCINANSVVRVLRDLGRGDDWVFHIDGDEVIRLGAEGLSSDWDAVELAVREVVSLEDWPGIPDLFKVPLGHRDLRALVRRGLIAAADNREYFHGHLLGKSGVRVGGPGWLSLHRVVAESGVVLDGGRDDQLEVFHFESYDFAEFVRKWTAILQSGPRVAHRPKRSALAKQIAELLDPGVPEADRRSGLVGLFREHVAEDAEVLGGLGLLRTVNVLKPVPGASTASAPGAGVDGLEAGLSELRGSDKHDLFHGASTRDGHVVGMRGSRPDARPTR